MFDECEISEPREFAQHRSLVTFGLGVDDQRADITVKARRVYAVFVQKGVDNQFGRTVFRDKMP